MSATTSTTKFVIICTLRRTPKPLKPRLLGKVLQSFVVGLWWFGEIAQGIIRLNVRRANLATVFWSIANVCVNRLCFTMKFTLKSHLDIATGIQKNICYV